MGESLQTNSWSLEWLKSIIHSILECKQRHIENPIRLIEYRETNCIIFQIINWKKNIELRQQNRDQVNETKVSHWNEIVKTVNEIRLATHRYCLGLLFAIYNLLHVDINQSKRRPCWHKWMPTHKIHIHSGKRYRFRWKKNIILVSRLKNISNVWNC